MCVWQAVLCELEGMSMRVDSARDQAVILMTSRGPVCRELVEPKLADVNQNFHKVAQHISSAQVWFQQLSTGRSGACFPAAALDRRSLASAKRVCVVFRCLQVWRSDRRQCGRSRRWQTGGLLLFTPLHSCSCSNQTYKLLSEPWSNRRKNTRLMMRGYTYISNTHLMRI